LPSFDAHELAPRPHAGFGTTAAWMFFTTLFEDGEKCYCQHDREHVWKSSNKYGSGKRSTTANAVIHPALTAKRRSRWRSSTVFVAFRQTIVRTTAFFGTYQRTGLEGSPDCLGLGDRAH
jgi:hypothetical protein